mgnify:FL=1
MVFLVTLPSIIRKKGINLKSHYIILLLAAITCGSLWEGAMGDDDLLIINRISPEDAKLYFIQPKDGEVFKNDEPIIVQFGLRGMGVAPAGVAIAETGHHHLLINQRNLPDLLKPIPASAEILHFGGGQTEAQLTLPPGKHTLQLLLGNQYHLPHIPPLISEPITIIVR